MTSPCLCAECVLAGCDRPPIEHPVTHKLLHGRELARWYVERDERIAFFEKLKADLAAKRMQAQRGDE